MDLKEWILEKVEAEIQSVVASEENPENGKKIIATLIPIKSDEEMGITHLTKRARELYEEKEKKISPDILRQIERLVSLQAIDSLWMEHLDTMDHLRQSVRLRGYAQKDPLVEYRQDGLRLFQQMLREIDKTIVYTIYKVEIKPREENFSPSRREGGDGEGVRSKVGRNDPCPCGSGKKYKKCGMLNTQEHQKLIHGIK